jgi:hypothetical protein
VGGYEDISPWELELTLRKMWIESKTFGKRNYSLILRKNGTFQIKNTILLI